MDTKTFGVVGTVLGVFALPPLAQAQGVETYVNDFDGWSAATGAFETIDFETLPDGSPSVSSTVINSLLNYTAQGATFSSPLDDLIIAGNPVGGFSLRTRNDGTIETPAFIRADLTESARSVGFTFGGDSTFEVFDALGELLASGFFSGSGSGFFLGVTSDVPIAYVIMNEEINMKANISSFHFAPVPEPGTAGLLGLGAWAMLRRGRRRGMV